MEILTASPVLSISGTNRGTTPKQSYQARGNKTCLMRHANGPTGITPLQSQMRDVRKSLVYAWGNLLSSSDHESWRQGASDLGAASGFALFQQLMWPRAATGLSIAQPFAAYTGPLLVVDDPEPTAFYDALHTPPNTPERIWLCPFGQYWSNVVTSSLPSGPGIIYGRITHTPVPAGRRWQPWMATAADSAALENSFLSIDEWPDVGPFGPNLCPGGDFSPAHESLWATTGSASIAVQRLKFENDDNGQAEYLAATIEEGKSYQIDFDIHSSDAYFLFHFSSGSFTSDAYTNPGHYSIVFSSSLSASLVLFTLAVGTYGAGQIDNVTLYEYGPHGTQLGRIYIETNISSTIARTPLPFYGIIRVFHSLTGFPLYSWSGPLHMQHPLFP